MSGGAAEDVWNRVDDRLSRLLPNDPLLQEALSASERAGLPPIQVSPLQGMFLHLLALAIGARRVLEVGTLGGYSTIWLARALPPDGRLVSLELEGKHAEVARSNLELAGVSGRVEVRVGPALASLDRLVGERVAPFDLVFIDADKPNNVPYFERALELSHPGTLVLVDNVVRHGAIVGPGVADPAVEGTRRLLEMVEREPRVLATALQTVGGKGYDGFLLARVGAAPRAGAPTA